jgi:hypothetical protein
MLDDAFWNFARDVKRCALDIVKFTDINDSIRTFINELEKTDYIQRTAFKDLRYDNLLKIKYYLVHAKQKTARSVHDKIFVNLLGFDKSTPLKITKIFDEFLKGITYFSTQTAPQKSPAYHRLSSCGTGTDAFRQAYNQCHQTMKKTKVAKVKKQIETCYIERLIYDDLYKKQTLFFPKKGDESPTQDDGHVHWLEQTKHDFQTCFPDVEINVSIEDFKDSMPLTLRIQKKKERHTIEEVYQRSLNHAEYDPIVVGRMYKSSNHLIKVRVQMFDIPGKWEVPTI